MKNETTEPTALDWQVWTISLHAGDYVAHADVALDSTSMTCWVKGVGKGHPRHQERDVPICGPDVRGHLADWANRKLAEINP